jgi:hypothetical protein
VSEPDKVGAYRPGSLALGVILNCLLGILAFGLGLLFIPFNDPEWGWTPAQQAEGQREILALLGSGSLLVFGAIATWRFWRPGWWILIGLDVALIVATTWVLLTILSGGAGLIPLLLFVALVGLLMPDTRSALLQPPSPGE